MGWVTMTLDPMKPKHMEATELPGEINLHHLISSRPLLQAKLVFLYTSANGSHGWMIEFSLTLAA